MKKTWKKLTAVLLSCVVMMAAVGCSPNAEETAAGGKEKLVIAYQYGMAYAPLQIMKEQKLIEKYFDNVEIEWQVLNSGAAINEGITGGSIDVGAMGVGPFVTGVMAGVPYKMFSNLSSQPHGIMTNEESIQSLKDITDEKIALVNIGSIQHVMLAMAAEQELGDAHALDNNIVAMAHPDGMTALLAGSVECQLTTSPYIFKEAEEEGIHQISSISDVWPEGNSFIVGVASQKLHDEKPELYEALTKAMADAITYINDNKEEVAGSLCENEGVTKEVMLSWLNDPACTYSTEAKGVMDMAEFMARAAFIEKGPKSLQELAYDNVTGD